MDEQKEQKRIRVTRNGPYMVSGHVPMHDETIGCDENGDAVEWIRGKDYAPKGKSPLAGAEEWVAHPPYRLTCPSCRRPLTDLNAAMLRGGPGGTAVTRPSE